uniref:Acyl-CoA carboxylase subunit epsilon n=1 Tax=Micromonospora rosaria TaxID=47874 RepID=A0A0N7IRL7_9ACTN|nr:hypothetical protein [Micromonospora rosaria]
MTPAPPAVRVVRGRATDDELAALLVVLARARAAGRDEPGVAGDRPRASWAHLDGTGYRSPASWR